MKKIAIAFILAFVATTLLAPSPAAADHNRGPGPQGDPTLDIDLKLGVDGFSLGGRVLGYDRVWGAWLNGERRSDGLSLDGRLQTDEKAYNFRLNTQMMDALTRAMLKWWFERP